MKIKTITCHDVYNTGASLQAYALSQFLRSLGHEVEIIDYKPLYLQKYSLKRVFNPRFNKPGLKQIYLLLKFPERLLALFSKGKREFDLFKKQYLQVTEQTYYSFLDLKNMPPIADVYIAGSDQIWNTLFENGKDPSFYLQFAPETAIKASYAASFATRKIEDGCQEQVKDWISKLDFVSVREKSGITILDELQIANARQVIDPVFLLNKTDWIQLANKERFQEKYIFIYDFEQNPKVALFAQELAEKNRWKIYSFLDNPYCDQTFKNEGPLMFLSLIYHAEYIVSNSFHATAFSLIFNKPFAVFDRMEHINTRMNDLLALVGLNKRNDIVDYSKVNSILEQEIQNSKEYLYGVLEAAEKR